MENIAVFLKSELFDIQNRTFGVENKQNAGTIKYSNLEAVCLQMNKKKKILNGNQRPQIGSGPESINYAMKQNRQI